jgi:23S rRNA (uridine2552-2'-O)-methyltransferase
VYKLLAIQEKDKIFKYGMTVVDLGAAPGGWSQVVRELVGKAGKVIALDCLPLEPITGVQFIQGDFTEQLIYEKLLALVGEEAIDVVISDMAPNISGDRTVDQHRAMYLAELALDAAKKMLKPGGNFVVKLFQGEGFDEFVKLARTSFSNLSIRKPPASKPSSRETYLVAKGFKG